MLRATNANIFAAMLAANAKPPSPAVSAEKRSLSPKARSFVASTPPTSPPHITTRSVSATAAMTKVTNDILFAAMLAAVPKKPAAAISNPTISPTTTIKARPATTVVVARRMIEKDLAINPAKLENASSEAFDASVKKTRSDSETSLLKRLTTDDDFGSPNSEKSGIMCVGLGGSRWASAEQRAREVPRPVEDILETQRQGMAREDRRINETCSLRCEGTLPTREEAVEKLIGRFMSVQKEELDEFHAAQTKAVETFSAAQQKTVEAFVAAQKEKLEGLPAAVRATLG